MLRNDPISKIKTTPVINSASDTSDMSTNCTEASSLFSEPYLSAIRIVVVSSIIPIYGWINNSYSVLADGRLRNPRLSGPIPLLPVTYLAAITQLVRQIRTTRGTGFFPDQCRATRSGPDELDGQPDQYNLPASDRCDKQLIRAANRQCRKCSSFIPAV